MAWQDVVRIGSIGMGATVVMDAWSQVLARLGVPILDYALVGRWAAHLARGTGIHPGGIARAAAISGERALGWLIHYAVGIAWAGAWVWLEQGRPLRQPELLPALAVGIATVLVPLWVMQPAMGAGFMARNTPAPLRACLRSLATHAVFGAGLYLSAVLVARYGG